MTCIHGRRIDATFACFHCEELGALRELEQQCRNGRYDPRTLERLASIRARALADPKAFGGAAWCRCPREIVNPLCPKHGSGAQICSRGPTPESA